MPQCFGDHVRFDLGARAVKTIDAAGAGGDSADCCVNRQNGTGSKDEGAPEQRQQSGQARSVRQDGTSQWV